MRLVNDFINLVSCIFLKNVLWSVNCALPVYQIITFKRHPQSLSEVYISSNKLHSKKSHVAKFMTSSIDPFIKGYPQCKFTTDTMSGNL